MKSQTSVLFEVVVKFDRDQPLIALVGAAKSNLRVIRGKLFNPVETAAAQDNPLGIGAGVYD